MIWGSPVFIMISGYLLIGSSATGNFYQFIKKRLNKIIIPLIFWNIIYYIYNNFDHLSLTDFLYQLLHAGTHSHLYFLNVMVGLYFITPYLSSIIPKIKLSIVVPILIILSSIYHYSYCFLGFPRLDNILVIFIPYIGYYLAGYWIGHLTYFKYQKIFSIFSIIFFVVSILITRKLFFIFETNDQDTILVSRLSLPVAAIAISLFYYLINITNRTLSRLRFLTPVSQLTFGIYLIHPLILGILRSSQFFSALMSQSYWIWLFLLFISTSTLSILLTYIINKLPILRRVI